MPTYMPQGNNKLYSTTHKYLHFYTQELFALNQFSIIFRAVKQLKDNERHRESIESDKPRGCAG